MPGRPATRTALRRSLDGALGVVFALVILGPHLAQRGRLPDEVILTKELTAQEQRRPYPAPDLAESWRRPLEWSRLGTAFSRWYGDRFGLRDALLRRRAEFFWYGLGTSPEERVVRGRNEWVFLAEHDTLDQVRGAMPLTEAELDDWEALLVQRSEWAAEIGARYVLALAPSKSVLYPEHLPPGFPRVGPSRLDQLHARLAAAKTVDFVDFRPALEAAKEADDNQSGDLVYYRLGTHWTERGERAASRAVIAALEPEIAGGRAAEAWSSEQSREQGDSWAGRLYLDGVLLQSVQELQRDPPLPEGEPLPGVRFSNRYRGGRPDGPRIVLHHDSYGRGVRRLLAAQASNLTAMRSFVWSPSRIQAEDPDVLIDLFIERLLVVEDPVRARFQTHAERLARFEASDRLVFHVEGRDKHHIRRLAGTRTAQMGEDGCLSFLKANGANLFELFDLRPPVPDSAAPDGILRIELSAPEGCLVELLCARPGAAPFRNVPTVAVAVSAGRQAVTARLPLARLSGGLIRVRSADGKGVGRWQVHRAEMRAVARPPFRGAE